MKASVKDGTATVSEIDTSDVEMGSRVSLDFSSAGEDVTSVQLSAEALKDIVSAEPVSVEIKLSDVNVIIDSATLRAISEKLNGKNISLNVVVGTDAEENMNIEQKNAINDMENATVFEAGITADGEAISDFGGGTVTIEISYTRDGNGVVRAWGQVVTFLYRCINK